MLLLRASPGDQQSLIAILIRCKRALPACNNPAGRIFDYNAGSVQDSAPFHRNGGMVNGVFAACSFGTPPITLTNPRKIALCDWREFDIFSGSGERIRSHLDTRKIRTPILFVWH
jgi:hypothetical protein